MYECHSCMTLTEKKSVSLYCHTELEVHGSIQKCFLERLRPHVTKLLDIVASEVNLTVENQVGDVIITKELDYSEISGNSTGK